jgi:hypothetical protein
MKKNGIAIVVVFLFLAAFAIDGINGGCYDTWSRCSKWSSFLTGKLWADCAKRCKELGKSGGNCVEVNSTCFFIKGKVLQCQCY